ncbi:MAG: RNA polymerase sigma factor [Vicinamibacterales bacterium]
MAASADHDRGDAACISRVVVHDDHQAFAALVERHQSAVRQFLRRLTGNDSSRADDLAQETFWRAYRHIRTYQGRGRFLSWLFGIAYQLFVSDERRARRMSYVPLHEEFEVTAGSGDPVADRMTFDQLMTSLRPEERAAVVMHYRHELTHPEIAEALGVPVGTVKSLIRRARMKLQAAYSPETGGVD